MADKNFIVKNGLTVGGAEIVNSSGALTQSLITAVPSGAAATTQSVGNATTGHEVGGTWCTRSADSNWSQGSVHWSILDAPATTSAKTYTVRFWGTGGYTVLNSSYSNDANSGNSMSSITAMEVVA